MAVPNPLPDHYISNWTYFDSETDLTASLEELRKDPRWQHVVLPINVPGPSVSLPFTKLDCPIHPIWRYSAWRNLEWPANHMLSLRAWDDVSNNVSLQFYERIEPALRMATVVLHRLAPMFIRIAAQGVRAQGTHTDLDHTDRFRRSDYLLLDQSLDDLATEFRIAKLAPQVEGDPDMMLAGCTYFLNLDATGDQDEHRTLTLCDIAPEKLQGVDTDAWLSQSEDQKRSLLLCLANTLVHELAHAVFKRRLVRESLALPASSRRNHRLTMEPWMYPETFAELGWSVMLFHYGCIHLFPVEVAEIIDPATGLKKKYHKPLLDGSAGLNASVPPANTVDFKNGRFYQVSLATIEALFDKRTWLLPTLRMHHHERSAWGRAYYRI